MLSSVLSSLRSLSFKSKILLRPTLTVMFFHYSTDEFVQYKGSDATLVSFRSLQSAVGRCCRFDRLLAADGGGDRPAAEPDH